MHAAQHHETQLCLVLPGSESVITDKHDWSCVTDLCCQMHALTNSRLRLCTLHGLSVRQPAPQLPVTMLQNVCCQEKPLPAESSTPC